MHEQILDMLVKEDEITWHSIIMDLIRAEKMDPWDIDLSLLTNKYIQTIKKLREANLSISGKVLLASAILLRIKSHRLVEEDLMNLDRMMRFEDETEELEEGMEEDSLIPRRMPKHYLLPRVPQPRKRKVSIYDLIDALQKALNVTKKRAVREILENIQVHLPERKVDIKELIKEVQNKIRAYYDDNGGSLRFSALVPSEEKTDKVHTLVPLLHLSNMREVDLEQEGHFKDFEILMVDKKRLGEDIYGQYEREQRKIAKEMKRWSRGKTKTMKNDSKKPDKAAGTDEEPPVPEPSKEAKEEEHFVSNIPPEYDIDENPELVTDAAGDSVLVSEVYEAAETSDKKKEKKKKETADYIQ